MSVFAFYNKQKDILVYYNQLCMSLSGAKQSIKALCSPYAREPNIHPPKFRRLLPEEYIESINERFEIREYTLGEEGFVVHPLTK